MRIIAFLISVVLISLSTDLRLSAESSAAKKISADISGSWKATASRDNGEDAQATFKIKKQAGKYSGTMTMSDGSEVTLGSIKFEKNKLKIETSYDRDGETLVIGVRANLNAEGILKGSWYVEDSVGEEIRTHDWKAVRMLAPVLPGTWKMVAKSDEGDYRSDITFTRSGEKFTAEAVSSEGEVFPLDKVTVEGDKLTFEVSMDDGSNVKVVARLKTSKKLSGKFQFFDNCNNEADSGVWEATK